MPDSRSAVDIVLSVSTGYIPCNGVFVPECEKTAQYELCRGGSSVTFSGCGKLQKVIFPEGLYYINERAFQNTPSLKEIELPSTLLKVGLCGFYTFSRATHESIVSRAIVPPDISSTSFSLISTGKIKVPAESVEAYKAASGWSSFASKIVALEEGE